MKLPLSSNATTVALLDRPLTTLFLFSSIPREMLYELNAVCLCNGPSTTAYYIPSATGAAFLLNLFFPTASFFL